MSAVTDILKQIPIDQLAEQLGASEKETKTASSQAITSLLAGMTSNTTDAGGEESLASALMQHLASGQLFESNGVNLNDVDTADGEKIVQHALGTDTKKAAAAVAAKTGADKSLLQKLLPILAPIVIAYIATKVFSGNSQKAPEPEPAQPTQSADSGMGSILGGLLGGGGSSAGGIGSILGGLLGGGSTQQSTQSSGGLSSMLGGLLGGVLGNDDQASKAQQSSGGILGGLLDSIF